MTSKNIVLPISAIGDGVVILSIKKWQKMERGYQELKNAIRALANGEIDLGKGSIRSVEDFLREWRAKNR